MSHEFRLQDPGEGIHEAEILEINVSKGDHVKEGDDVIVAETDKAAVDIPAPISGNVQEIRVSVGDIVKVGDVLMVFGDEDDDASEQSDDTPETEDQSQSEPEEIDAGDDEDSDTADKDAADTGHKQSSDPNEKDLDPDEDTSEKREEQSTKQDRDANGADDKTAKSEDSDDRNNGDAESEDTGASEEMKSDAEHDKIDDSDVRATPAVRGLAHEVNVDLATIEGSGDEGRILEDDVREATDQQESSDKGDDDKGDDDQLESDDSETVVKLRTLRRTTARRMEQAWRDIPHVTHHDVIEITDLERLRQEHAAEIEERGGALTLTPFIVKALVIALADYPNFNATFDVEERAIHRKKQIDVGVAFDTERGLIVPVLRNAGRASIAELALQLSDFDARLRKGNATAEDLRGATFTLTNIGAIGGTGLTPIINPPQTAIFGTARAELRQVVRGDLDDHTMEVALCLPVCLTFDHRVADGAEAARFMNAVRALLADPGRLMLHS